MKINEQNETVESKVKTLTGEVGGYKFKARIETVRGEVVDRWVSIHAEDGNGIKIEQGILTHVAQFCIAADRVKG